MEGRIARPENAWSPGYTRLTDEDDAGVELGVHVFEDGTVWEARDARESAWLLLDGRAEVDAGGGDAPQGVARRSLFDEAPTVAHVPGGAPLRIESRGRSEWVVARATNARDFAPRVFLPAEVEYEYRGAGLAAGACLRNVRQVFDARVRPESALVLGEVVNYPGRWSSYPPHHHDQPEVYHYRFTHPLGYGHGEVGERVFKVHDGDTLCIPGGHDHAQVAAPGYGMYYVWVVRHLPCAPYDGFTFTPEHAWVLDPQASIWQPAEGPS